MKKLIILFTLMLSLFGISINCFADSSEGNIYVDGKEIFSDVEFVVDGRDIFIPLEALTELMNYNIRVDLDNMNIYLTMKEVDELLNSETTSTGLYTIDGVGIYEGYKILKGYEKEKDFLVYFEGNSDSFSVFYEDLRKLDLNQIVIWEYEGQTVQSKLGDLHKLFFESANYSNILEEGDSGKFTPEWFIEKFGDIYLDWFTGYSFSTESDQLVNQYFKETGELNLINRYDTIDISAYEWITASELENLGVGFYYFPKSKRVTSFREHSFMGYGEILHEMHDYKEDFTGIVNFNGIRMKNEHGYLEFHKEDLKKYNIIE